MEKSDKIKKGSVIQITENHEWQGCLLQVDEVKSFGVVAGVQIPCEGLALIRLNWEDFEYIGEAILVCA